MLRALLFAALVLLFAADVLALTNAEAIRLGRPLPHPKSVLRCPPGGCSANEVAAHRRKRSAPSASPSPLAPRSANFNFDDSCLPDWIISNAREPMLTARCRSRSGEWITSAVALRNHITAYNGQLLCGSTGAPLSCSDCTRVGQNLQCMCDSPSGPVVSRLPIGICLKNNDGKLA